MKHWLSIFRQLIVILLIFQVSAAYALPTGVHLNLCLGFDGHVDLSQEYCDSDSSLAPQQLDLVLLSAEDHHGDCLDVEIGCVSSGEFRAPTSEVRSSIAKVNKNESSLLAANSAFSFRHQGAQSSIRSHLHSNGRFFPPPHLDSLRSIILLI